MSEKFSKMLTISERSEGSDQVEVWTQSYIVRGHMLKDKTKAIEGVVTLTDANIMPVFCECGDSHEPKIHRDWINIFEEHIISFTIYKGQNI